MLNLNDPNFGTNRSSVQSESKLDNPDFGKSRPSDDPYVATKGSAQQKRQERDSERFDKKLQRELKYGRLSSETRSKLVGDAINDFVNKVVSEKATSIRSTNLSSTGIQSESVPLVSSSVQQASLLLPKPPPTAKNQEGFYRFPRGCPFDLIPSVGSPSTSSIESSMSAVEHQSCIDGLGNNIFRKYGSLYVNQEKVGVVGYHGEEKNGFFELATKGQEETYLWGYTKKGENNFRAIVTESDGAIELWRENDGARCALKTGESSASFEASLNDDFSYITQNTLRIEYSNGDSATMNPSRLFLNYESGSWLDAYGGGLYMNDGSNFVQINPPFGEDAYFQQVTFGDLSTRYVLCSPPINEGSIDCGNLPNPVVNTVFAYLITSNDQCGFPPRGSLDLVEAELTLFANDSEYSKVKSAHVELWKSSGETTDIRPDNIVLEYQNNRAAITSAGINFDDQQERLNVSSRNIVISNLTQLYQGGIYLDNGSGFVDIKPPEGSKNAYFQKVSLCVDGQTKTAYVLMTLPE